VVVGSRKLDNLEKVSGEIKALGRNSLAVATDVRIPEQVDNLVKQTVDNFGRIDILVNNAGASFVCPIEEMSPNGWDVVMGINLRGTFLCSKAAGKVMIQQKKGKIINITSVAGVQGHPGMAHYGAAKAGIINFTKSLSMEWAKYNINVNAIAPGMIETEAVKVQMKLSPELVEQQLSMIPMRRYGYPEEIAYTAVFLASEASSYLTGESIVVDGGPRTGLRR
jgi:NAD(P)-dependent dehydrogenase (short-subunit alcohol dehydrogenase family)